MYAVPTPHRKDYLLQLQQGQDWLANAQRQLHNAIVLQRALWSVKNLGTVISAAICKPAAHPGVKTGAAAGLVGVPRDALG